jgi:hypothetical protein
MGVTEALHAVEHATGGRAASHGDGRRVEVSARDVGESTRSGSP